MQSSDPIFARTYVAIADYTGSYQFNSRLDGQSDAVAIPLEPFTLSATHPVTKVVSPTVNGTLSASTPSAVQPVVFSNTGQI
ncbi:hypothetical protein [Granulicella tundricola]|uniref:Cinnamoyl-CoA reductase, putative n=1 Tax=Granulicella tundricola (strain ATCC BAA-1859 / DSM 23138 / MP5ACTX9) TaxID=1198114 RepID=E8X5Y3_GRATM|nr:hypothetical protein [Granulicella tundricola]ADW70867.1 cinnamoyl-CoA reductase, putative [Granulicella tundricola MP5ACTX9]